MTKRLKNKPKKIIRIMTSVLVISVFLAFSLSLTLAQIDNQNDNLNTNTNNNELSEEDKETLNELNQEIDEKKKILESLEAQSIIYEQNIAEIQKQIRSLKNEIAIIENQSELTRLDIQKTENQIEILNLEIEQLQLKIKHKRAEIKKKKEDLKEIIAEIYKNNRKTYLEITITNNKFSDFLNQAKYLKDLEVQLKKDLDRHEELKRSLEIDEENLNSSLLELQEKKQKLEFQNKTLEEQKIYKNTLLAQTQFSENKYRLILEDLRDEAERINSEIASLERRMREKLSKNKEDEINLLGPISLIWPVNPIRGISAYFHDPTYPFRCLNQGQRNCIGEHAGIDIPVPQGTPVSAAEDGYVAIARKLDWIRDANGNILRPAYNYVTIIHGGDITTVYGHLSAVYVVEDTYVRKGDIIGLSGGLPGTAGAGVWTTGAHLHFEVRIEGIPDDPLKYLP